MHKEFANVGPLKDHIEILHNMAHALLDWETIDKYQIDELMQGKKLAPPEPEPEPEVLEAAIDLDDDQQGQSISQEPVLTS